MMIHPENSEELNEIIRSVEEQELVDVWCKGCEAFRKMNIDYSKYLKGEIDGSRCCKSSN